MVTNLFWHSILMHFSLGVDSGLRHLASMLPCLPPRPGTVPWSVDSWLASTCWRAWAIPAVLFLFHLQVWPTQSSCCPGPQVTVQQHEWCGTLDWGDRSESLLQRLTLDKEKTTMACLCLVNQADEQLGEIIYPCLTLWRFWKIKSIPHKHLH